MTEKTEVEIIDLGKCFSYLNSLGENQVYLTPQGIGIMEGMILTNPEVEVVSQDKYNNTKSSYNIVAKLAENCQKEIEELKIREEKLNNELDYRCKTFNESLERNNKLNDIIKGLHKKLFWFQK